MSSTSFFEPSGRRDDGNPPDSTFLQEGGARPLNCSWAVSLIARKSAISNVEELEQHAGVARGFVCAALWGPAARAD